MAESAKTLTPLGISVLALLSERPMHPYEMYQLLIQRHEDRIVKVRPGSLYHTVSRLAEQQLVSEVGTDREGNRPERTTYAVTDGGRSALTERVADVLGTPAREYPAFPLALAEAHNLEADRVVGLLRSRTRLLAEDIEELEEIGNLAHARAVPRVFWVVVDYLKTMQNTEMHWLNELTGQIESGELPWLDSVQSNDARPRIEDRPRPTLRN